MQCPKCEGSSVVYGTFKHGSSRERYRRCKDCGHKWKTWEEGDQAVKSRKTEDDAPLLAVMEQDQ